MADPKSSTPAGSQENLVAWMTTGCKPVEKWRVGTEHEKFGFYKKDLKPIPYDGPVGVEALLKEMARRFDWTIELEGGRPIALKHHEAAITLEPGGQLELSGAPMKDIHAAKAELDEHLQQLSLVCRDMGIAFLSIGTQPKWPFTEIPWMPKGRYRVMREYLPNRGHLSLDMMTRTATVQANLDFGDEADMVKKFRVSLALQPLVTALFANSPFMDGKPTGFLSYRANIWHYTDPDRCGSLPFVFEKGFGFERYVAYALETPMLFFYREGRYQSAGGVPFREFLAGRHPALPGVFATFADWELHLSSLFPNVRLKRYLETRGADAGNSATLCALPAFWKGILYHAESLEACWEMVKNWTAEERRLMNEQVARLALKTPIPGKRTLRDLALEVLLCAMDGLSDHHCLNAKGCDETVYLKPLMTTAESGVTPAERLLTAYHGRWGGCVDSVFVEDEFDSFLAECG
ncbi:MAG: glutamate--cysteine ligase [Magnetococcales bacterium]|nr:glutamate--cysteine ligase [Magnetococcales bacterium]MBF0438084.1 glutamate--cysteine ligase [Magnetococcales bacterium]